MEMFIVRGQRKYEILAPRWRGMTGKRLLKLEYGERLGRAKRGRSRQGSPGGADKLEGTGRSTGARVETREAPLSGLDEEDSDSSSIVSDDGGDH